ncbi:MAG: acetyl-CoA C-acyltransferase, partial [Rhodobacteraceae bacterium]|nr:acetyl-CoA C-acyltransferase [Paracoccaceae bacterium]
MRDAVIVSTARTPIGKAYRGAFNNTQAQALIGHAVGHAVNRAGLDGPEVQDCIIGSALQQGSSGGNIGRQAVIRAGLPVTVAGMSLDRQCASGMMAIATAAKQVILDGMDVAVGGGVESISLVQNQNMRTDRAADPWIKDHKPSLYMSMLETAEIVADRYGVTREDQDAYALQSQQRTAAAQAAGKFDDEIVAMTTSMGVMDKDTKEISFHEVTLDKDEGNRPSTTLESLAGLQPVFKDGQVIKEGQHITAGNASQLSDGASASVLMEATLAEKRGLEPLGRYVGVMAAGLEPDEMGIGPIYAVPKLLEAHGLKMDDIGLWELNEAFASQVLHSARALGIPNEVLNVNGGAISVG